MDAAIALSKAWQGRVARAFRAYIPVSPGNHTLAKSDPANLLMAITGFTNVTRTIITVVTGNSLIERTRASISALTAETSF
jgi:hypothetical protein